MVNQALLPSDLHDINDNSTFKDRLKGVLFDRAYNWLLFAFLDVTCRLAALYKSRVDWLMVDWSRTDNQRCGCCYEQDLSLFGVVCFPTHHHCHRTMSVLSGETFASSMSRDVLEDWLAVLFQENKTQLESSSSTNDEVIWWISYSPVASNKLK